ncbi:GGDEF domain-containing protein [Thalassotalea crassostreae]|uniref:GGDEF domain-containing protein n=1 Tax=Thalassotalea crassostreae TaxID=1763536 RepID=UPI000837D502|nr:GGDEF domain-containing protein [Thalassotalea crassostreae]
MNGFPLLVLTSYKAKNTMFGLLVACLSIINFATQPVFAEMVSTDNSLITSQQIDSLLLKAHKLRSVNAVTYKNLVDNLTELKPQFNQNQLNSYQHLLAIQRAVEGKYQQAIQLLLEAQQSEVTAIRFEATRTLVSVHSLLGEFKNAGLNVSKLIAEIDEIESQSAKNDAYDDIANFYQRIGEDQIALSYLQLTDTTDSSLRSRCNIRGKSLQIKSQLRDYQLSFEDLEQIIKDCDTDEKQTHILYDIILFSEKMLGADQNQQIIDYGEKYLPRVKQVNHPNLSVIYYSVLAEAYLAIRATDKAKTYAEAALALPLSSKFHRSLTNVYRVLSEVEYSEMNYPQSLAYLNEYQIRLEHLFELDQLKEVAREQINHININQQNQKQKLENLLQSNIEQRIRTAKSNLQKQQEVEQGELVYAALFGIIVIAVAVIFYLRHRQMLTHNKQFHDPLTKLKNRSKTMEVLATTIYQAQHQNSVLSLMIIKLHNAGRFHHKYGFAVGDEVLKNIANILAEETKELAEVGQIGANEFALIFYQKNSQQVIHHARSISTKTEDMVRALKIDVTDLKLDIGISDSMLSSLSPKVLMRDSSNALMQAKNTTKATQASNIVIYSKHNETQPQPENEQLKYSYDE